MLLAVLGTWCADSCLLCRPRMGEQRLPRVLNKTVEGPSWGVWLVAGIGLGLAVQWPLWYAAVLGMTVALAAEIGDLVESAMKRGWG